MGVRIREELRQAIRLNNSSHDKRRANLEDKVANTKSMHPDSSALPEDDNKKVIGTAAQASYPLLKPITFTNMVTDDYLDGGVWQLK